MNKYLGLYRYFKFFKTKIALYLFYVIGSVIFNILSLSMLAPFLNIIFGVSDIVKDKPVFSLDSKAILATLQYHISQLVINNGAGYALSFVCILIIINTLLKNLFVYLSYTAITPVRYGVSMMIRRELFNKILKLPIGYFTEKRKGDIMSRMSNDMYELEAAMSCTIEATIKEPLNIIFFLTCLFFLSFQLSLLILILIPITGFIIGKLGKSLKKHSHTAAISASEGLSLIEETLSGLRIIKAFIAEKSIIKKFDTNNKEQFAVKNKINIRKDLSSPLSELLGVMALCVVLWIGGNMVLENRSIGLTGSAFIVYIVFFTQIINPAKSISSAFYAMQKGTAALHRIEEILNADNAISENENGIKLKDFQSNIELRNVSFGYNDVTILKNINLTIQKGKTVALVGSSGAGKSTLADLVPRFHDVSSGELLIDGVNIKDYNLESIRNKISIVTQEPILFNDTIANNIKLGVPTATNSDIENASKVANAYNFITKKEEGFDSNIGDRGTKLSGGERQRLTIARAVLKNSPILILDEATSSLDTESERLVQDAINKMMQNRTTIVIAHRLSTIRHADEIIVLQKGEIAERGNHDALMQTNGIYKRLVDMQELK